MVRFLSGSKKMECREAKLHRRWGAKWLNYVWWVFLGRGHSESSSKGGGLPYNKIGKKSLWAEETASADVPAGEPA